MNTHTHTNSCIRTLLKGVSTLFLATHCRFVQQALHIYCCKLQAYTGIVWTFIFKFFYSTRV